jgi:adenylate cyclase
VAVLAALVVGFSRPMGVDVTGTLHDLVEVRRTIFSPMVTEYRGRVVELMGDSE